MQSNGARALLVLVALVVVVIGFIALRGEDEAGEGSALNPPAAPTTDTPTTEGGGGDEPKPEPEPEPELTTIVVKGGEPEGGVAELEYEAGDQIRFAVESDATDEVHVHGYDLYEDVAPGEPAKLDFPADLDGIYEIEFHDAGTQVAELVVNP